MEIDTNEGELNIESKMAHKKGIEMLGMHHKNRLF